MPALLNDPSEYTEAPRALKKLTAVHFDVVDGCQLRCVGCPNSGLDPKPEFIAPDVFRRCLGKTMGAINLITVSCDGGGTPAQYEALRPPAEWSKLLSFLSFARDLATRYPRLHLQARCVIEAPEDQLFASRRRADFLTALTERRAKIPVCNRCDMGADLEVSPSTEAAHRFRPGVL